MSRNRRRRRDGLGEGAATSKASGGEWKTMGLVLGLMAGGAAAVIVLSLVGLGDPTGDASRASIKVSTDTEEPAGGGDGATAADAAGQGGPSVDYKTLEGAWRRTDGDYSIEISNVQSDGGLTAAYFNPSPINVSQAEAGRANGRLELFVELRDVNYPGCTYRLRYDPRTDSLIGVYNQTAAQQQFRVTFVRGE